MNNIAATNQNNDDHNGHKACHNGHKACNKVIISTFKLNNDHTIAVTDYNGYNENKKVTILYIFQCPS